jgi:N-acetylmuramoyl-L-alanine amidase
LWFLNGRTALVLTVLVVTILLGGSAAVYLELHDKQTGNLLAVLGSVTAGLMSLLRSDQTKARVEKLAHYIVGMAEVGLEPAEVTARTKEVLFSHDPPQEASRVDPATQQQGPVREVRPQVLAAEAPQVMRVTLSCDENPGDPGTTAGGLNERDVNISVCSILAGVLHRCGVDVAFDPSITYVQRVARANGDGTDLLVAIAHNAAGSPAAEGTVFVFCGPEGKRFGKQLAAASAVGNALIAAGVAGTWTTFEEEVYECCAFNKDTVYCEVLYQTNPRDLAVIKEAGYAERAAEAIAKGLSEVYGFHYTPAVQPAPAPVPVVASPPPPAPAPTIAPTPAPAPPTEVPIMTLTNEDQAAIQSEIAAAIKPVSDAIAALQAALPGVAAADAAADATLQAQPSPPADTTAPAPAPAPEPAPAVAPPPVFGIDLPGGRLSVTAANGQAAIQFDGPGAAFLDPNLARGLIGAVEAVIAHLEGKA